MKLLEVAAVVYKLSADKVGNCLSVVFKCCLGAIGHSLFNCGSDVRGNSCIVLVCGTDVAELQILDSFIEEGELRNILLILGSRGNNGQVAAADEVVNVCVNIFKESSDEVKGCLRALTCGGDCKAGAAGQADEAAACQNGGFRLTGADVFFDAKVSQAEVAQIGQYAENVFFGKKCGLLDQTVSSYGGLVSIDFNNEAEPIVEKIDFDFEKHGYTLCITDTKSSHENLTDDYVAIREEMKQVSDYFDCEVLSEVDEKEFFTFLPNLRNFCSDRAIMRAMHFFGETKRAREEAEALKNSNIELFLKLVNESGISSGNLLQNLFSTKTPTEQAIPLALAISKSFLGNKGAVRVHGGGFAGTIQAFVPTDMTKEYKNNISFSPGKEPYITLKSKVNSEIGQLEEIKGFLKFLKF